MTLEKNITNPRILISCAVRRKPKGKKKKEELYGGIWGVDLDNMALGL